jgi:hypothetical protein
MIPANDSHDADGGLYVEIDRQYEIPIKVPMLFFGVTALLGAFLWIRDGLWDAGLVIVIIFVLWWLLNVYPKRRYRIGWDNLRIYMREGGFKRSDYFSIAFDEIKAIETGYDGSAGAKARFYPFDYIEMVSKYPCQKPVVVHPPSLKDGQVKSMLLYMYGQRPELFPQDVIDYMHSDRPL